MTLADIVEFNKKQEPLIWVCSCGCTSFSLFNDDNVECVNCGKQADAGMWIPRPTQIIEPAAAPHQVVVIKEASPSFMLHSALQAAGEIAFAVIQYVSGRQVTWSMIEADDAAAQNWAKLKLDDARRGVLKEAPPKCH